MYMHLCSPQLLTNDVKQKTIVDALLHLPPFLRDSRWVVLACFKEIRKRGRSAARKLDRPQSPFVRYVPAGCDNVCDPLVVRF